MKPILTPRLQAVADMTPKCGTVADIGTDHAYLPIYLISENKCEKCIAADIATGPLNRAREYIEKHLGKDGRIKTVLSDGLKDIEDEYDAVTIAGMGGETIAQILKKTPLQRGKTAVLQPMTKAPELRKFLYENGFWIEDEIAVGEDRRVYSIIKAVKADSPKEYEPIEIFVSAPLLKRKDKDAEKYKEKVLREIKKKTDGLEKAENRDEKAIAEQQNIYERLKREI